MADASNDNQPENTQSSVWRRALGVEGNSQSDAVKDFGERFWYCVYVWWRRAGLDPITSATATAATFNIWADDKLPHVDDSSVARMREWTAARLPELAQQGVKLTGEPLVPIDQTFAEKRYAEEPEGDPMSIFQRRWALTVIEITTVTLRNEYTVRNEAVLYEELHAFAGFDKPDDNRYAAAAERLGKSTGAVRAGVYGLRTRQREIMLQVVADTVLSPEDAESEITALMCSCDAPGADAALPTVMQDVNPDEVLVRAMNSVRMTQSSSGEWQPPTMDEMKMLFPQYNIVSLVGRGGMGAVYKAKQIELDRTVAIKLLPLEVSVNADFADRFRREARAMAKLHHPNIILVYEFGTTSEGHLFFVMEFVDGADLHQMIHGPGVTPPQALNVIVGVCDALAYAHEKGVVHRDVKPANIMVSVKEEVKVADFGLARLLDPGADQMGYTMTGTVMGTPDYMAPEQMTGMNVDHRADIYSLGVMLYEMLCGEVPRGIFEPPSARCAEVGTNIDQVVTKAMQQQPDSRYQNTTEMKTDVTAASDVNTPAPKEKTSKAFWKRPARVKKPSVKKPRKPARVKKPKVKKPTQKRRRHREPISAEKKKQWRNVIIASAAVLALACAVWMWAPWSGSDAEELAKAPPRKAGEPMVISIADGVEMAFRWCPPGDFVMGSSEKTMKRRNTQRFKDSIGIDREKQRQVKLSRGFWIGETEVTQAQWVAMMKTNPSGFKGEQRPVEMVTWSEVNEFCSKLTERLRKSNDLPQGWRVMLPTDAQWEYACRAGTTTDLNNGQDLATKTNESPILNKLAWYSANSMRFTNGLQPKGATHEVALLMANRWGLYDTHGNVLEYCVYSDTEDYPEGKITNNKIILRGGSWDSGPNQCRSAHRPPPPDSRASNRHGFRVILVQERAEPTNTAADFRPLFDGKTLAGYRGYAETAVPGGWRVADGVITGTGNRTYIVTEKMYEDFELRLDWRVGPGGNGGIFFRMKPGEGARPLTAPEFQLCSRDIKDPVKTGALHHVLTAKSDASRPTGQWNTARLVVVGTRCEHWVNNQLVCSYDLGSDAFNKILKASRNASKAGYGKATKGRIGLESWAGKIEYRNIRIRDLKTTSSPATPAKQSIDLLALTDPLKDDYRNANNWEKSRGILSYKPGGAGEPGKIASPVAIKSRNYEIEVTYRRDTAKGSFNIDLPLMNNAIASLVISSESNNILIRNGMTNKSVIGDVPKLGNALTGTIRARLEPAENGTSKISVYYDNIFVGTWQGNLAAVTLASKEHPGYPGENVTGLWCPKDSYDFTSWKLRIFDGEAKVLRHSNPAGIKATFNGHRYLFVPSDISWNKAKAKAESMDGHLAAITTKEEFDWVVKTFRNHLDEGENYSCFWIGGIAQDANSGWKWITGEKFDKAYWAPHQPDVGKNAEQGGYPAYMNIHRSANQFGFNDSSDTAKPIRHWRDKIIGFLVEWDSDKDAHSGLHPQNEQRQPINLLPLIDPGKDAITGSWKKQNGVLTVQANKNAHIEIPYNPPAEYDFRVTFIREKGNKSVNQILTKNNKMFVWDFFDGRWGFFFIGQTALKNPTVKNRPFENGKRYTSTVHVRNDGVSVTVNGELVSSWKTNYEDMSLSKNWALRSPTLLGLGSDQNVTKFEKVEIIEITGKGKPSR